MPPEHENCSLVTEPSRRGALGRQNTLSLHGACHYSFDCSSDRKPKQLSPDLCSAHPGLNEQGAGPFAVAEKRSWRPSWRKIRSSHSDCRAAKSREIPRSTWLRLGSLVQSVINLRSAAGSPIGESRLEAMSLQERDGDQNCVGRHRPQQQSDERARRQGSAGEGCAVTARDLSSMRIASVNLANSTSGR